MNFFQIVGFKKRNSDDIPRINGNNINPRPNPIKNGTIIFRSNASLH